MTTASSSLSIKPAFTAVNDAAQISDILGTALDVNSAEVATLFGRWIAAGTQKRIVNLNDITVYLGMDYRSDAPVRTKLHSLLSAGTKLIDALIYLSQPDGKIKHSIPDENLVYPVYCDEITHEVDMRRAGKLLAAAYLWILFRARWPDGDNNKIGPGVPSFIANLVSTKLEGGKSDMTGNEISANLASFNLEDLHPDWVKHISLSSLGEETRNRIAVGVAGYRYIKIFGAIKPDRDVPAVLKSAHKTLFNLARQPESWDIHPATRSSTIVKNLKSINKGAANLMLLFYSEETLKRWVKGKMIPQMPKPYEGETGFISWQPKWATQIGNFIMGGELKSESDLDKEYEVLMGSQSYSIPFYNQLEDEATDAKLKGVLEQLQQATEAASKVNPAKKIGDGDGGAASSSTSFF